MTLEELRKRRDKADSLRVQLLNSETASELASHLFREHCHAEDAYAACAVEYVDNLLDAMPREGK